jgi:hypothetical protein
MKTGTIKKFKSINYNLYDGNSKFIGKIENEAEFLQVRIDLVNEKSEGYFVLKNNGDRVYINIDGSLSDEDYDNTKTLLNELKLIQMNDNLDDKLIMEKLDNGVLV